VGGDRELGEVLSTSGKSLLDDEAGATLFFANGTKVQYLHAAALGRLPLTIAASAASPIAWTGYGATQEMCDEYELCHTTQARMTLATGTAGAVEKEYVALGLRIEGELLRYLAENADE
jgi:hypothetical protein